MVKLYCPKCMDVYTPNHQDTTTQMEHILELGSHTCYSWFTLNIDLRGQRISLCLVYMDSRSIIMPINFSNKPQLISRPMNRSQEDAKSSSPSLEFQLNQNQKSILTSRIIVSSVGPTETKLFKMN